MKVLGYFANLWRTRRPHRGPQHSRLELESLETRVVPYATTGNVWPNPQLVTISFMPDGTNLGGPSSNLFSAFNSDFGSTTAWENQILKAAQTWAQVANINFTVIGDNDTASGGGSYQQGDPGMGDIRIGGFNFSNSSVLGLGYMPPPVNNYSIAGDIGFNTGQIFNINGFDYDLYSVALHEMGHALGLDHSTNGNAVMYASYQGLVSGLNADDVAGIQSLYGTRAPDPLNPSESNNSFASATDITSLINSQTLLAQANGLDITNTSDVDFYQFTAPTTGSLTVTVQSRGLSLLAPSLKVYNANQTQLVGSTGSGDLGTTLNVRLNVTAGQVYTVRIAGANSTAFGTGDYALSLNFGSEATPVVASPDTQLANGDPLNGGGGLADRKDANGNSITSLLDTVGSLVGSLLSLRLLRQLTAPIDLSFADLMQTPANYVPNFGRTGGAESSIQASNASVNSASSLVADLAALSSSGSANSLTSPPIVVTSMEVAAPMLANPTATGRGVGMTALSGPGQASQTTTAIPEHDDTQLPVEPLQRPGPEPKQDSGDVPSAFNETGMDLGTGTGEECSLEAAWLSVSPTGDAVACVSQEDTRNLLPPAAGLAALVLTLGWPGGPVAEERRDRNRLWRRNLTSDRFDSV